MCLQILIETFTSYDSRHGCMKLTRHVVVPIFNVSPSTYIDIYYIIQST